MYLNFVLVFILKHELFLNPNITNKLHNSFDCFSPKLNPMMQWIFETRKLKKNLPHRFPFILKITFTYLTELSRSIFLIFICVVKNQYAVFRRSYFPKNTTSTSQACASLELTSSQNDPIMIINNRQRPCIINDRNSNDKKIKILYFIIWLCKVLVSLVNNPAYKPWL